VEPSVKVTHQSFGDATAFVGSEAVRSTTHGVSIQESTMIIGRWRYNAALNTGDNLADFMA
jgi:hypothetical protein